MDFPFYCSTPGRLTTTSAWHQHIPFAMYLIQALRPGTIVELGTHKGDSYCSFCQAVKELKLNARCFAVDTWKGDEQAGYFGSEVIEELRAHHDPLYGSFSKLMQCSFDEALSHFADGTIDILHIDGCHTYAAVKHDFHAWLPKISQRGIVLMHDTDVREGDFGVWRLWDEIKREYPHFEFLHGHGLGVLGVGKNQPACMRELFQASEEEIEAIRKIFFKLGERITLQIESEAERERLRQTNQKYRLQLEEYKLQLGMIQASNGWRALQHLYRLRDKTLPKGSRRRKALAYVRRIAMQHPDSGPKPGLAYFMHLKKYLWYCRIYGLRNATRLALRKLRQPNSSRHFKIQPLFAPISAISGYEEDLPLINKKISVVVPTKNAGKDFQFLLKKLNSQKGLRECEIIIVDSGSTDGTLEIAAREGAKILEIPPESFNHGYARNKGAENSSGDYVLFLVQDAFPMTDRWLWEMARTLEQNDTVAVSCAEYPRSDCDLFYQHVLWNHYRSLSLDKDRFLSWDESCSTQIGLRSNSQISDIAALIRLDIFNKYKFRTHYAEDLDLGIRLIKDGHRIGFLYTTRVLHSHNRSPYYFLKRAYVDCKFLKELFPGFQFPAVGSNARLFGDMAAIYCRTKQIASAIEDAKRVEGVSSLFDVIRAMYSDGPKESEDISSIRPENEFEDFIRSLALSAGELPIQYKYRENILLPHMLHQLKVLQAFISESRQSVDETVLAELAPAMFKILALHCGAHMAYLYLTISSQKPGDTYWSALDSQLTSGI
jgi:glycosyltransferase involved in cell wall biosynthesis